MNIRYINIILFLLILCALFIFSCNEPSSKNKNDVTLDSMAAYGKILAATWCASCHVLPDPSILPKKIWKENVLPFMGLRLGFYSVSAARLLLSKEEMDSRMENTGNNNYTKHVLIDAPGAIKAIVKDASKDGLPDIWVLMAQGDESIYLLLNKGNSVFESRQVLRFSPSYGSASFELDDFNKDGYPDILYTCGDNADVSQVLKPYHGVYIFMNDKRNYFTQKYFYPMNGCYKAMAADFDDDGDLDIAAIAFFADYLHHPENGFIFLKNDGNNSFKPFTIPEATTGRRLCMDVEDLDGDKKPDIVLGNMPVPVSDDKNNSRWVQSPALLFLKNIMPQKNK